MYSLGAVGMHSVLRVWLLTRSLLFWLEFGGPGFGIG